MISRNHILEELDLLKQTLQEAWSYLEWNEQRKGLVLSKLFDQHTSAVTSDLSKQEYTHLLLTLAAQLHDGHVGVGSPSAHGPIRSMPAQFTFVGRQLYLSTVTDKDSWDPVPLPGSRVITYDGELVEEVVARRARVTTSSTERQLRYRVAGSMAVPDSQDREEASLTLQQPDGSIREFRCRLIEGAQRVGQPTPISLTWIEHGVAHLRVPSFSPADWFADSGASNVLPGHDPRVQQCIELIDSVCEQAKGADTIILDVRGNGGGTDLLGQRLASHFLEPGFVYFFLQPRRSRLAATPHLEGLRQLAQTNPEAVKHLSPQQLEALTTRDIHDLDPTDFGIPVSGWWPAHPLRPESVPGIKPFTGRVVLLIDAGCFSTTDNFVACLQDQHPNLHVLGTGTAGGTGAPRQLTLPHSQIIFQFCTMKVFRPNGGLIEGIGSEPDLWIEPMPQDLVEGRDPVLEFAMNLTRVKAEAS